MPGYTWATEGNMMYSDNLSDEWRTANQPLCRFRQFCDLPESEQVVTKKGDIFTWNIYHDLEDDATGDLIEDQPIPTSKAGITQGQLTVVEKGWGTPYTGKLEALAQHPPRQILDNLLGTHCVKTLDKLAAAEFDATPIKVGPAGGTDAAAVEIGTDGVAPVTNDSALTLDHVLNISQYMAESDIPGIAAADGEYYAIGRPTAYSNIMKELEQVRQYTAEGFGMVVAGEIGRHHGVRFVKQTNIAAPAWDSGASSKISFFGADAAVEGTVLPEQIRVDKAKNHGRLVEMAWYYLGGFKITRADPEHARIVQWDSAA